MLGLLLMGMAAAELPPVPYDRELGRREWVRVYERLQEGDATGAREQARDYQERVLETAGLNYLIGRSSVVLSDTGVAREAFRRAVVLDPGHTPSWTSLGDLAMAAGDWDEAKTAWQAVTDQVTDGRDAWLGPFRLAEVAANQSDPLALEAALRLAIRRGFSLSAIAHDPAWHTFYANPTLQDSLQKMLVVYADPTTRAAFDLP